MEIIQNNLNVIKIIYYFIQHIMIVLIMVNINVNAQFVINIYAIFVHLMEMMN